MIPTNLTTQIKEQIKQSVIDLRSKKPLVPSITNTVTINLVANTQLAVGASAAMIYLPDEGEFIATAGESVYINLGTLFPIHSETLIRTAKTLNKLNKPWVLDPVAIGIGELRTDIIKKYKEYKPSIIRGNASEIIALAKIWELTETPNTKGPVGVDSTDNVSDAQNAAIQLAKYTKGAVAVSGEEDLITDGTLVITSMGGSHFMEKITGAGCSLGGVCAAYSTVTTPLIAALTATQHYNFAGKQAELKTKAPGSFQVEFIDQLYIATPEDIAENPFIIK